MDLYDAHRDHRDKFEVIAFHDATAKTFEELDKELAKLGKTLWRGRSLPFPILLDSTGETLKTYDIHSFPTTILIDPDGKLVGQADDSDLDNKLPPIPAAERVKRALNRDLAIGIEDPQLAAVPKFLGGQARIDIHFEEGALKAAGVTEATTVPLTMSGSVTLRSWLNLLLGPFDLTYRTGEKGLVIAHRQGGPERAGEPSEAQRFCAQRIEGKLDGKVSYDFRGKALAEVAKYFEDKTGENFVLDPVARRAGRLDPKAPVTGTAKDEPLRDGLRRLLEPLGLRAVVRDEVVVITVK
jgi:hypothetical protein